MQVASRPGTRQLPARVGFAVRMRAFALPCIVLLSVCLRIGSALVQGDAVQLLPGIYDQVSYDALARRVLEGYGFSFATAWWPATQAGEPTAHWSYLYTLYLSSVYAVVGPHPLAARLIQALAAGILQPWLTWRLGNRLFGRNVGLAAGAMTAVYSYFVYYAGALMTETFYMLAILWLLEVVTAISAQPELRRNRHSPMGLVQAAKPWVLLGLALGVATLLRQVIVLTSPLFFGWLLLTRARPELGSLRLSSIVGAWKPVLLGWVVSGVVILALIAPWTIRNFQAFGRFVPLNTNAGFAMFWGNHPVHGSNFISILPSEVYANLIPPEFRGLDEAELDQMLMREALGFIVNDPSRYVRLSVSRIKDYFEFWPSSDSSTFSNLVRASSFGLLLPLALYGLAVAFITNGQRYAREKQLAPAVLLLCVFVGAYSLLHLLSWALIRYRLPVDEVLIVFGGVGAVALGKHMRAWLANATANQAQAGAQ